VPWFRLGDLTGSSGGLGPSAASGRRRFGYVPHNLNSILGRPAIVSLAYVARVNYYICGSEPAFVAWLGPAVPQVASGCHCVSHRAGRR
jgi:hypothetical protein